MDAVCRDDYGGVERIDVRDIPEPQCELGKVKIRVHATTINRTDCGVLTGLPKIFRLFVGYPRPRYSILGTDFAGEVVEVGEDCSRFRVGQRVFGFEDIGIPSQAEYYVFGDKVAAEEIPEGVSYEDAVASLEGAHYAICFLKKIKFKAGDPILVLGATGAIGSSMIQLLSQEGCQITTSCRREHFAKAKELGAVETVDYQADGYLNQFSDRQFVHVFDAVGKSSFSDCKRLIRKNGVYISSELGPKNENPFLAILDKFLFFKSSPRVVFPVPMDIPLSIKTMKNLLQKGQYRPLIDRSFAPHQAKDAYDYCLSESKVGNILFKFH